MKGHIIDLDSLPENFPSHRHSPKFWEALGRTVGTFGFLEDTLKRAIFAVSATAPQEVEPTKQTVQDWQQMLEWTLSANLNNLVEKFGKEARQNSNVTQSTLSEVLEELAKVAPLRNLICHGFWQPPNNDGFCEVRYINRNLEVSETPMDLAFLNQIQTAVSELGCHVMNLVTDCGFQFPGSDGPGVKILPTGKNADELSQ